VTVADFDEFGLLEDPYQHAACGSCYPVWDRPYGTFIGLCGQRATDLRTGDIPQCPDCQAVISVLRRCLKCGANLWYDYEEEDE